MILEEFWEVKNLDFPIFLPDYMLLVLRSFGNVHKLILYVCNLMQKWTNDLQTVFFCAKLLQELLKWPRNK